jgi:hypothetical protein
MQALVAEFAGVRCNMWNNAKGGNGRRGGQDNERVVRGGDVHVRERARDDHLRRQESVKEAWK